MQIYRRRLTYLRKTGFVIAFSSFIVYLMSLLQKDETLLSLPPEENVQTSMVWGNVQTLPTETDVKALPRNGDGKALPSVQDTAKGYLTAHIIQAAGLGNQMFVCASLIGIAEWKNKTASLDFGFEELKRIFSLPTIANWPESKEFVRFQENDISSFDVNVTRLVVQHNGIIGGYFQSWKYFHHVHEDVRKAFRLKPWYLQMAADHLNAELPYHTSKVRVGIHVRRADYIFTELAYFGYTVAPIGYIKKAMSFFRSKYRNVIFIVCSDDIDWCIREIKGKNIHFVHDSSEVDFAVLTMCDHMIMTVGTFGWWAAWLANGTTVYYNDWPRKGSTLDRMVQKENYFPPHWIPME